LPFFFQNGIFLQVLRREEVNMKGYLILEDGSVFEGTFHGEEKEILCEVVFTTAMTGYEETVTDPSFEGQAVVLTWPMIGNYGANLRAPGFPCLSSASCLSYRATNAVNPPSPTFWQNTASQYFQESIPAPLPAASAITAR
jgi:hypothetical protein